MAAFLHYSPMRPSGVPRSQVGTNFFCLNRFSQFKCHSVEEVQGYNMKLERKVTANRFQRYTRSKLSKFLICFACFVCMTACTYTSVAIASVCTCQVAGRYVCRLGKLTN